MVDMLDTEEDTSQDLKLELAQNLFLLRLDDAPDVDKESLKASVINTCLKDDIVTLYISGGAEFGWAVEEEKVAEMKARIEKEVEKLDERIKDAEENLGESEVREAQLAKALFFIRIGDAEKATEQLKLTETKTVAIGQKMDLVFYSLRLGLFSHDFDSVAASIEKAKSLFGEGGDWERKNRLKVYEGLFCMATRNFKKAADLFLDSISTFTTYELFSYSTFVLYSVLMSVVALDRVSLKKKVIDAPEILTVIDTIPALTDFLNSLHACNYKKFFQAFSKLTETVRRDRYLAPHFRFFMREIRVVAYAQFLESYKSVTIDAMAASFGVSPEFIDKELSLFIANGRLNCKIDKVAGILETNRPDSKNALYQSAIKQGDLLLNRLQNLSRVIDV